MICFRALSLLASLSLVASNSATAQESVPSGLEGLVGTNHTQFMPFMQNGKLVGCTMTFTALVQDYAYSVGAYLKLTGNVGLMVTDKSIGANVKLLVHTLDFNGHEFSLKPSPPSRVYLIGSDFNNTVALTRDTFSADDPGGIFVVLDPVGTMPFFDEIMKTGKIGLGFNQNSGGTDMTTEIDFNVLELSDNGVQRRGTDTIDQFSKCMLAITSQTKP